MATIDWRAPRLGVNIDHVATVREARKTFEPNPVWAAALAELGGADGITLHLREDRRHIQDRDLELLCQTTASRVNLELACEEQVLATACRRKPHQATLVPERREEVTTEGGLDVVAHRSAVTNAVHRLQDAGIVVSLFVDPIDTQIRVAAELEVDAIELHTGSYAEATSASRDQELERLVSASSLACSLGLQLHAGHGLNYQNVKPIAAISDMHALNIGHSIVARSICVGMQEAVRQMKQLIDTAIG